MKLMLLKDGASDWLQIGHCMFTIRHCVTAHVFGHLTFDFVGGGVNR